MLNSDLQVKGIGTHHNKWEVIHVAGASWLNESDWRRQFRLQRFRKCRWGKKTANWASTVGAVTLLLPVLIFRVIYWSVNLLMLSRRSIDLVTKEVHLLSYLFTCCKWKACLPHRVLTTLPGPRLPPNRRRYRCRGYWLSKRRRNFDCGPASEKRVTRVYKTSSRRFMRPYEACVDAHTQDKSARGCLGHWSSLLSETLWRRMSYILPGSRNGIGLVNPLSCMVGRLAVQRSANSPSFSSRPSSSHTCRWNTFRLRVFCHTEKLMGGLSLVHHPLSALLQERSLLTGKFTVHLWFKVRVRPFQVVQTALISTIWWSPPDKYWNASYLAGFIIPLEGRLYQILPLLDIIDSLAFCTTSR